MKSVVCHFYFSALAVLALSHPLPRDGAPSGACTDTFVNLLDPLLELLCRR